MKMEKQMSGKQMFTGICRDNRTQRTSLSIPPSSHYGYLW